MPMLRILTLACAALLLVLPDAARAEPRSRPGAYGIGFLGGMLLPLGDTGDTHQRALAAGLRMGYTGKSGLGLDMVVEYSPLSLQEGQATDVTETHFATLGLMPRFTLGNRLRVWAGAGGGLALQYDTLGDGSTEIVYEPAGMGALGLELDLLTGVGLVAMGSYTRTFGELGYEYVTATGGLLLTFR